MSSGHRVSFAATNLRVNDVEGEAVANELGRRIREERERRVLTQEEAARELGINARSLQAYEAGKALPRQARRRAILAWLGDLQERAA